MLFHDLESWLAYDYLEKFCNLHESDVQKKLSLSRCLSYGSMIDEFQLAYGFPLDRVVNEMLRRLGESYSFEKRFLLNHVIDAIPVISYINDINLYSNMDTKFEGLPYKPLRKYSYSTMDGRSSFGNIIYFNNAICLPLTLWYYPKAQMYYWELVSWPNKFPIFGLDKLYDAQVVYVHQDEIKAKVAREKYYTNKKIIHTTWPGGYDFSLEKTDWSIIGNLPVFVAFEYYEYSFQWAKKTFNKLKNFNLNIKGFKVINDPEYETAVVEGLVIPRDDFYCMEKYTKYLTSDDLGEYFTEANFDKMGQEEFGIEPPLQTNFLAVKQLLKGANQPTDDWVIPQLIRQGDRVMVYAPPKAGKTIFLLHVCWLAAEAGKSIAYIDGELRADTLKRHLGRLSQSREVPEKFFILSSDIEGEDLNFEKDTIREKYEKDYEDKDVIVIDNLHAIFPSSLQSGPEGCEAVNQFKSWCFHKKKTVIFVHHSSRGGSAFGSSSKQLGLDITLNLKRGNGKLEVVPLEPRDLPEKFTHKFEIPFSEENGLSSDWFDPQKRYLKQSIRNTSEENEQYQDFLLPCKTEAPCSTEENSKKIRKEPAALASKDASMSMEEKKEMLRKMDVDNPGLSVRAAAKRLGVSKSTVSIWRKEKSQSNKN